VNNLFAGDVDDRAPSQRASRPVRNGRGRDPRAAEAPSCPARYRSSLDLPEGV